MAVFPVSDLEIIAYADVLDTDSLPYKVAPIFRFIATPDQLLFPPFRLIADQVNGDNIGSRHELNQLVFDRVATMDPDAPRRARPDHVLWVENGRDVYYMDREVQLRDWRARSKTEYALARTAFDRKDFEQAGSHARMAFAFDERKLEALALQAASDLKMGDREGSQVLRDIAEQLFEVGEFDEKLRLLMAIHRTSILRQLANIQPQYNLPEATNCELVNI